MSVTRENLDLGRGWKAVVWMTLMLVAAGCSDSPDRHDARSAELTVVGCLTTTPNRSAFALTPTAGDPLVSALANTTGQRSTFTYEIEGDAETINAHAGRVVMVTGTLVDGHERTAKVEEETRSTSPADGREPGAVDGEVSISTDAETEIEVRRLRVAALEDVGGSCTRPEAGAVRVAGEEAGRAR